ncbi:MAG: hotdog fold thioesterase [Deltaproteobacteria bacterium]|nr:hotdog fold thioesterase [Deltaproteobacteria bacterium]
MQRDVIRFFEESLPFNKHLGMKVVEVGDGICKVQIPFQEHLVGDPSRPALHGGVISALADTAGGLAAALFAGVSLPEDRLSTVDLRVDYLRPALLERLCCEARLVRSGNRVAVAAMVIHQRDGTRVVAEARGVYSLVRGSAP